MFKRMTMIPSRQRRFRLLFTAFAVLLSCLMLPNLFAQTDTGNIVGTVTDSTGAIIPGAPITATNTENGLNLMDKQTLELHGDAFNHFNTPEFANPEYHENYSNFGQITSLQVYSWRQIQLAARFTFYPLHVITHPRGSFLGIAVGFLSQLSLIPGAAATSQGIPSALYC